MGRARATTGRKPGSTSAAPMAPGSCFAGTAGSIWRRRATASVSTIRCSRPSSWIRRSSTRISALGLYHYYAAIAPRAGAYSQRADVSSRRRSGRRPKEMEQTRTKGHAAARRSGLPAALDLSVVRAAAEHRAQTHRRTAEAATRTIRCSTCASRRCRANTCATTPPRCRHTGCCLKLRGPGASRHQRISEVNARLGMAQEMDALCETTNAIDQLHAVIALKPGAPYAVACARTLSTWHGARSSWPSIGSDRCVSDTRSRRSRPTIVCAFARRRAQRSDARRRRTGAGDVAT